MALRHQPQQDAEHPCAMIWLCDDRHSDECLAHRQAVAVTGAEGEGNIASLQQSGDRQAILGAKVDVQKCKAERVLLHGLKRLRNGTCNDHSASAERVQHVLGIDRDEQVVFDQKALTQNRCQIDLICRAGFVRRQAGRRFRSRSKAAQASRSA